MREVENMVHVAIFHHPLLPEESLFLGMTAVQTSRSLCPIGAVNNPPWLCFLVSRTVIISEVNVRVSIDWGCMFQIICLKFIQSKAILDISSGSVDRRFRGSDE